MKSDFVLAFNEIAEMRKLPREVIMEALQAALVSAYRRNTGVSSAQHVEARVDGETGLPTIWVEKEVVEQTINDQTEIALEAARQTYPDAELGAMVMVDSTPRDFGRIAAQTAKQVILQRMREAEREAQFQEYQERIGDLVTGTIQSESGGVVTVGLGRTEAILPPSQQMPGERYRVHNKVRAYVMDVKKSNRGPQIVISRTHRNMLRRLLEYEVPEIYNGTVEIKSIAREPGHRSKVAVAALQEGADPVGACVGMKGVRIQSIVKELNNEKIDVIEWNPDQKVFISKALSPARVSSVFLDDDPDEGRTAIVVVPDDQLSLAIGREGQNARLAAKLTGWRIDIKSVTEAAQEALAHAESESELADLYEASLEVAETVRQVLDKKENNKPIMPEEYTSLVSFTNLVENQRLALQEGARHERRRDIEAARAQVPAPAYDHPLDDTDLPLRVYNSLFEHGYQNVGQVMEKVFLNRERFFESVGLNQSAQEAVLAMIESLQAAAAQAEAAAMAGEVLPTVDMASAEAVPADELAVSDAQVEGMALEAAGASVASDEVGVAWDEEDEARARRAALVAGLTGQDRSSDAQAIGQADDAAPSGPGGTAPVPQPDAVPEEVMDEEEEVQEVDLDEARTDGPARGKQREKRRQLVYDEDLGRVVAKRKRKRGGKGWEEYGVEEEDF